MDWREYMMPTACLGIIASVGGAILFAILLARSYWKEWRGRRRI
jgi:hypothetical protein